MKKLSILICCLCFCSFLKSQTFAPIGTKWGYNYIGIGGSGSLYLESVADTVIQGKTCRKLVTQNIYYICPACPSYTKGTRFIHENNEGLFALINGNFVLMFRYNLQIGDTFSYTPTQKYLVTRKVDTLISGQTLKKWQLKSLCTDPRNNFQLNSFVEKIGSLYSVLGLGYYCFSDPDYYNLCTFSSGNLQVGVKCTYTKNNDLADDIGLKIHPNPTSSFLNIETNHPFSDFKIYDLTGKLVQKGVYTDGTSRDYREGGRLDISTLAQGIYVLQLIDKQQLTIYRKFVKSRN